MFWFLGLKDLAALNENVAINGNITAFSVRMHARDVDVVYLSYICLFVHQPVCVENCSPIQYKKLNNEEMKATFCARFGI